MNSINNNLDIQHELEKSIVKSSVNEGNKVNPIIEYPAVVSPLSTVQTNSNEFSVINNVGDVVGKVGNNVYSIAKKSTNTIGNVSHDLVDIGISVFNIGYDLIKNTTSGVGKVSGHVFNSVLETSSEVGHKIINTLKDVVNETNKARGTVTSKVVDGLENVVKKVENTVTHIGDEFKGGVSVNLQNNTTRILIPNNFLTSKHIYLINYNENGTHLHDYKFEMKGGQVSNLNLKDTQEIWSNSNSVMPVNNNSLDDTIRILNNLITDLSNSPQVGGFVRNRVSDKDEYYTEYKNLKLKYLSLKH
jgi:hypothetical protein